MKPVTVAASATLVYTVVGLLVLNPHTLFSVDAAVKLLQARSLIETGLRSLSLPYPAASLDAAFEFFPFAPPFVFKAGNSWQGVFSSGVALFNAAWLLLGVGGVVLASAVAGGITLGVMSSLETKAPRWAVPLVLGIGTSFWFYCVLPWEHVPALALSSAAWVMLFRPARWRTLVAAAAAFGAAVVLREESLLLLPGFLWALWVTQRDVRALVIFTLVLAAPLCLLSAADVLLFHRPPAAHLAHVSELLAGSLRGGSSLPVRDAWPVTERAETILQQLVLGREGWSVRDCRDDTGCRRHGVPAAPRGGARGADPGDAVSRAGWPRPRGHASPSGLSARPASSLACSAFRAHTPGIGRGGIPGSTSQAAGLGRLCAGSSGFAEHGRRRLARPASSSTDPADALPRGLRGLVEP